MIKLFYLFKFRKKFVGVLLLHFTIYGCPTLIIKGNIFWIQFCLCNSLDDSWPTASEQIVVTSAKDIISFPASIYYIYFYLCRSRYCIDAFMFQQCMAGFELFPKDFLFLFTSPDSLHVVDVRVHGASMKSVRVQQASLSRWFPFAFQLSLEDFIWGKM